MKIDSHHHLWHYNEAEYDWIDDFMSILQRDFLSDELENQLNDATMDGSVVVQARQSLQETVWLCQLADSNDYIKGVVGWIDLCAANLPAQLEAFKRYKKLKGFRHVLQGESDDFMARPSFIAGLKQLAKMGYRYDLLILSHQLPAAIKMLSKVPELDVVIDHIAKPMIKTGENFEQWKTGMARLADNPKVHCKISGMVTEADWVKWKHQDFAPYMNTIYQLFGPQRILFGSDWPVCLVAAKYKEVQDVVNTFFNHLPQKEQQLIWGENAIRFYKLSEK